MYELTFREREVGGPVIEGQLTNLANGASGQRAEAELAIADKIVFLLHGYNVSRTDGRSGLGNLAKFISVPGNVAVVSVLWPGDSMFGFVSYPFEGTDADDTGSALVRYIDRVFPRGARISFVTHSLGARVCMRALGMIVGSGNKIEEVCLMAPAIDDFSLASPFGYRSATSASNRVAVLASECDRVLKYAYAGGDLLQAFIYFWRDEYGAALGYRGPRRFTDEFRTLQVPANVVHQQIDTERKADHGHYVPGFGPGKSPKGAKENNQRSAALFACDVVKGDPPVYR